MPETLLIGTYPAAGFGTPAGAGEGLWRLTLDLATGELSDPRQVAACPGAASALAHVERAGDRLLVGCRGADAVTGFTLAPDGSACHDATYPLPGRNPRHHRVVGDWLVVALQQSHRVVALDRDGTTRGSAPIPSPACIRPAQG